MAMRARGAKPCAAASRNRKLKPKDARELRRLLRDGHTLQRVAQRPWILLACAQAERTQQVVRKVDQHRTTIWRVCERYRQPGLPAALYDAPRSGRPHVFSKRQRKRIESLARRTPRSVGWALTHWSARSLALAAVQQAIVTTIHPATISRVLRDAEVQPHRFRYWKTTLWDDEAVERALKILWVYERIEWLWQRGEVVLALDEKPSLQVLERCAPTQPVRPGRLERHEFEYVRHGTVNLLVGLNVFTGRMWA